MKQAASNIDHDSQTLAINFHGASIIDESGREIPITEQMLQQAFRELIRAWEQGRRKHSPRRTFKFY